MLRLSGRFILALCASSLFHWAVASAFQGVLQRLQHDRSALSSPSAAAARCTRFASVLAAKKKSSRRKPKGTGGSTSGFGGAAVEPCPCGSDLPYNKCCGRIHKDLLGAYPKASPSDVVRARYSAYSKRVVSFIMASTHPLNHNFESDIKHWKETIEKNCYDNFVLNKCDILDESCEGEEKTEEEVATVRFLAHLTHRDSGEKTAFIETSTFLRDPTTKAWLYRDGEIETVEDDQQQEVISVEDPPPEVRQQEKQSYMSEYDDE